MRKPNTLVNKDEKFSNWCSAQQVVQKQGWKGFNKDTWKQILYYAKHFVIEAAVSKSNYIIQKVTSILRCKPPWSCVDLS